MEFLNPKKKKYNFDKFLEEEKPEKPVTIYDDPEWKDLVETVKRQAEEDIEENNKPKFLRRNQKTESHAVPKDEPEKVEVNIRLTVPKLKWDKIKGIKKWLVETKAKVLPYLKDRRVQQIGIGVIALLITGSILLNIIGSRKDKTDTAANKGSSQSVAQSEQPVSHDVPFDMLLPDKDLPKEAVSYNSDKNFAKFDDKIGSSTISVTEQPLPNNFKSNPANSLEGLAKQMNAAESIETTTAGTIYIQQASQGGAQTAIFVRGSILGFIRTQNEVGASKIAMYIDSLK